MDKERVTAEVILELKKAQDALKESQRTASSYWKESPHGWKAVVIKVDVAEVRKA